MRFRRILFASETIGAVREIEHGSGHHFDDGSLYAAGRSACRVRRRAPQAVVFGAGPEFVRPPATAGVNAVVPRPGDPLMV